ncbi:biotin--[acetyl-CoA-carboxylase] ligase [Fusobacterium necrophorum]|uniref:Biotin--[acetyl-CoA-carboxylase] ligase n=1 Tax=Fusobacterium necrophorum subsp. funduliforme TaxID=143387 RepID=A0A162J3T0_9FUSO|nr:biotin--[acetyl-CoA-carboxylase] ligase [Fusobacterium necrophorum]AYV93402.1 biotin--[acetyl-CoA-carboxylase] ligase [Fusobacterium necrophorum subsp. funduliforme]EIJ67433.1 biotin--[acetyl-CoA-carboxylase] ligase [Fusobacterium necrophorum subsp. funduliforme ATCC 51357]KAB0552130.1 biotin--[acetyl-CoA-carboxylase] ligase [Fusobacterium necrophorum subsp. funduliforme]KYL05087.1 biotin--[acetyl-CoA-carboxylase] ligase [Fusobacterium necrophorum subsp. funduliforme]KYM46115.1 biotin--[ace
MNIYSFEVLDSTNDYMKEHRKEFEEFDIVMAKNQRAGKGRRGNIWISTEGMALFTFLVKKRGDKAEEAYMKLPLLAGLAVIRALQRRKKIHYQLKWTNDIYLQEKKLAGILVERRENDFFIGIGINVNNAIPIEIKNIAISLQEVYQEKIEIESLILSIVEECRKLLEEYFAGNWKNILQEINAINYLQGKKIGLRAGNLFVQGIVQRIDENGELEILSKEGLRSFGMGEVVKERILVKLEKKLEILAKIYILKEANYDVIAYTEEVWEPFWEQKLEKLQVKIERNVGKEELKEKYQAKTLEEYPNLFPLEYYDEKNIKEVAKIFA